MISKSLKNRKRKLNSKNLRKKSEKIENKQKEERQSIFEEISIADRQKYISTFGLYKSNSSYRKKCYDFRLKMVTSQFNYCFAVFVTGFIVMMSLTISILIMFKKQDSVQEGLQTQVNANLSQALVPYIVVASFILVLLFVNLATMIGDIDRYNLFVWNRDSLGSLLMYILVVGHILGSLLLMKTYIRGKELSNWQLDSDNDDRMNAIGVFVPFFVLVGLYFFKYSMLKTDYGIIKSLYCLCIILLAYTFKTHQD